MTPHRLAAAFPLLCALLAGTSPAGGASISRAEPEPSAYAPATSATGWVTLSPPRATGGPGELRVPRYAPGPGTSRHHAQGALPDPTRARFSPMAHVAAPPRRALADASALPASVDLSGFAPAVGDQGNLDSCVSWVVGYELRGWYANRDGYGGSGSTAGFSPMYLYSQLTGGTDSGSSFWDTLNLLQAQGTDTRAHYSHGDQDYRDQPNQGEKDNAAQYAITSWKYIVPDPILDTQQALETALSQGNPVGISMFVFSNFFGAGSPYIDVPRTGIDTYRGSHAVMATGYDAMGLWVENQWSPSWGKNGYAELSWAYVNTYLTGAVTIVPAPVQAQGGASATSTATASPTRIAATATGTAVASPTTTATVARTSTATRVPTSTSTAIPASTATRVPAATSTGLPTALPTGTPTAIATATAIAGTGAPAAPDLAVSLRRAGSFRAGQRVGYTVFVRNVGTGPTTGRVTVTAALPRGMTALTNQLAEPPSWTWSAAGSRLSYDSPAIAGVLLPKQQLIMTIPVLISATIAHPTTLVTTITVDTAGDGNAGRRTARSVVSIP